MRSDFSVGEISDATANFNPRSYMRSDDVDVLAGAFNMISIHAPT